MLAPIGIKPKTKNGIHTKSINNVHKQNLHTNTKTLQQQSLCVLEFQITKSDFKTHNLGLCPKHKIVQTPFTLELVPN
jgi:hypothetical protein